MLVNNLYTKYFAHFLYLIYNAIDNIEVNNYAIPIRHTRGWLSQNHCGRPDPMQTLAAANLLGYSGENQKQKPINNAEFPTWRDFIVVPQKPLLKPLSCYSN